MSIKSIRKISEGADEVNSTSSLNGGLIETGNDPNEKHLATDHLQTNIRHRTVSSGVVTLTAQGLKFALIVASTVILARLLTPHDFGLLAMVTMILGLLRIFKDAGLSSATIQRDGITHAQVSNLFWINTALGGLLALVMAAAAPAIAWFYREPSLIGITIWLSATLLIRGSTIQHQALLRRQMRFKAIAAIEVGSMVVSLFVGVLMALWGCGYWSLVGMNLAAEVAGLAITWLASRWRPQWPRWQSGTRPLLSFGVSMTASGVLYAITRSVDSVLVGWRYGADSVGLYSRASALLMRPLDQLLTPVGAVLLPMLSRLQSEPERYRRVFLQLFEAMVMVSCIFAGLFFALSRPLTLALLGPKWEAAAVIFTGFTLTALYLPITAPVSWLFISLGRSQEFLWWNTAYAVISIVSFIIGLPFGPVGVAFAFSSLGLLSALPICFYMAGRSGPVSTKDLWIGLLRHLPLWGVVAGAAFLAHIWANRFSPLAQLLICTPIGLGAAGGCVLAVKPQRTIASYVIASIRGMLEAQRKARNI